MNIHCVVLDAALLQLRKGGRVPRTEYGWTESCTIDDTVVLQDLMQWYARPSLYMLGRWTVQNTPATDTTDLAAHPLSMVTKLVQLFLWLLM